MKAVKAHLFFIVSILILFPGCKGKDKVEEPNSSSEAMATINSEITYSNIPDSFLSDWQSDDKMIGFYIGSKDKSGMTALYQLFCGNGRAFASGLTRHSYGGIDAEGIVRHEFILLEAPDESKVDFSASDGPDEKKQDILDYLFPDGSDFVIEYTPDY